MRAPKRSVSTSGGVAASRAMVAMPSASSRSAVFGPDAGQQPRRASAKRSHACSRVSTTKPCGFSASEATFATSRFGPMPTEAARPVSALDLGDQPPHRGARRHQPGELEVGLVEAHRPRRVSTWARTRSITRRDIAR